MLLPARLGGLLLILIEFVNGGIYFNKCYCTGVDPLLTRDEILRDKLHSLRRQALQSLPVYKRPIHPANKVPPVDILAIMFPDKPLAEMEWLSLAEYSQMKANLEAQVAQRAQNLNGTSSRRKKRDVHQSNEESSHHIRRRSLAQNNGMNGFHALLKGTHAIYGVFTHNGELKNSTSCTCENKPTSKVRKLLTTLVAWDDDLLNLGSPAFKALKMDIETRVDDLYTANDYLLQDGYAGATMLSVALVEQDVDQGPSRRKREVTNTTTPGNTTQAIATTAIPPATTTAAPVNDRVRLEVEIVFAGRENQPAPKKDLDNIMSAASASLGIEGEPARDADCKGEKLPNLLAPSFMTTTTGEGDLVPSGEQIKFTCANPGKMLPFAFDPDSNFALEVNCVDGEFIRPPWPESCVPDALCTGVANPPAGANGINLVRKDNRTRFRQGEFAYFACQDPIAVLDDNSGKNVYELECLSDGTFGSKPWPNCFKEPTCKNLQDPPAESKLVRATKGDSVKLGDFVLFECAQKDEFYETDQGPNLPILCEGTASNPIINLPSSWPECQQLPCVPLGQGGLNYNQSLDALEFACPSNDSYELYTDAQSSEGYIIPRRFHCGTYKPNSPTFASQCAVSSFGTPQVFWNEMEITSFNWLALMSNAKSSIFKTQKAEVEKQFNSFYLANPEFMALGYLRTVVVKFHQGASKGYDASIGDNQYCVKVTVEHQFKSDANVELGPLKNLHRTMVQEASGHLTDDFSIVADSIISGIQKCHNDTLASFFTSTYVVSGADQLKEVGDYVNVTCAGGKFLRQDRWDQDSDDNILTIRCKPNRRFDVPIPSDLPQCAAKCPAVKPQAPPEHNILLNTNKTTQGVTWEGETIWYKCANKLDGIAGPSPKNDEMEGTEESETSIICGDRGEYLIPRVEFDSNETAVPKCLPRPRRCQCLGDFKDPSIAKAVLDLYCRNETSKIMMGTYRDAKTKNFLDEVVPSKIRCGSRDPLYLLPQDKCNCYPTDGEGADDGKWIAIEIVNMAWREELKNPKSKIFKEAKYIIEKAFDEMYLDSDVTFQAQYVRTIVMAFSKGLTDVTKLRWKTLNAANMTNGTDIHKLNLTGDPIIDIFEPTQEEKARAQKAAELAIASGQTLPQAEPEYSVQVRFEVQFRQRQSGFSPDYVKQLTQSLIADGWVNGVLWVNPPCFDDETCYVIDADYCSDSALADIGNFGLTHSNNAKAAIPVSVGSTIDLFCLRLGERVAEDIYDDNSNDHRITLMCKPNGEFDFPESDDFPPVCLAWCPGDKPTPPPSTGLNILKQFNNQNETVEGLSITYICNDTTMGVNAGDSNTIDFKCINAEPRGRYDMPNENQTWPQCMKRTTTIRPPIKLAVNAFLKQADRDLIDQKTEELYLSERNAGDENFALSVLIPSILLLVIVVLGLLCCTRIDNPLCKYCSKNYVPM